MSGGRRSRRGIAVLAAALAVVTAGCTGVPDRSREAQQLEDAVAAMPGVGDASFAHENAIGRGAVLYGHVWMPDATRQQVLDVVNTMNDVRRDRFDGYDQSTTFQVTADRRYEVECGATLDAATIADQAMGLRELSTRITAEEGASASCGPGDRGMSIRASMSPVAEVLDAVRAGNADLDSVHIMSAPESAMTPFTSVTLRFPFSIDDWNRFQQQVSRMDGTPWLARLGPGAAVTALGVHVRSPQSAYRQLSAVIAQLGAGPQQPMRLSWALENREPTGALKFTGSVDVGGCEYGSRSLGDENPQDYYTPESIALQKRMRTQYDTCPK